MKTGLAQDTTKSAKNLAQQIAKQMAQEPLEILKTAGEQTIGSEVSAQPKGSQESNDNQKKLLEQQQKLQDNMKSNRRIEALDRELTDIRKQDLFKDLQSKIAQGEEIPLEDYPELSLDQKQVLKAQMEAVKFNKKQAEYNEAQAGGSLFGSAKRSRRFGQGQKQEAEKQQTRVEKPVPPSG